MKKWTLSENDIQNMQEDYLTGLYSYRDLVDKYHTSLRRVSEIMETLPQTRAMAYVKKQLSYYGYGR